MPTPDSQTTPAVETRALQRTFRAARGGGEVQALAGVDLRIERGEIFGLLGPNGAGKTTTVEILEGYRRPDGGSVEVLGEDPQRASRSWRTRVGVVLQSSSLTRT